MNFIGSIVGTDKGSSFMRGLLAVAAMLAIVAVLFTLMGWTIPKENRDVVMILVGALITKSEKVDNFFFGSSEGSKAKSSRIENLTEIEP